MELPQSKLVLRCFLFAFVFTSVLVLVRQRAPVSLESGGGSSSARTPPPPPPPKVNIFSIETKSGKRRLSSREACSAESAALHHRRDAVFTLYNVNGLYEADDRYVNNLLVHYPDNIQFRALDVKETVADTPLGLWHGQGRIAESRYPTEHLSDALRIALLYKHGGIYMDTDTLVIHSLTGLVNAVGLESEFAATGLLAFQANSSFLHLYMSEFADFFNGGDWGAQGPTLVTKLLKYWCHVASLKFVINQPEACQGILLLPPEKFYPIEWFNWEKLIQPAAEVNVDFSASYAVHLFGSKSREHLVRTNSGTLLDQLFQRNCPYTYQLMIQDGYL